MRGYVSSQRAVFLDQSLDSFIPEAHPIRRIKPLVEAELKRLSPEFDKMYAEEGRPSIPPERLLQASLLMALFSVRSERQFCEELRYNMLFRWFLDMEMMEEPFDASTFSKNKKRLLDAQAAKLFFDGIVRQAGEAGFLSDEHFTVDGTLIEAWASLKSFKKKDAPPDLGPPDDPGNPTVDFHGEKRGNATHASTTDPEAKLARKGAGKEAKLCFSAHVLMENRNGLCVDFQVAEANGYAEREEALAMIVRQKEKGLRPKTLGADKGYDCADFVKSLREEKVTPHVSQNTKRRGGSRIDGRTTRHAGYKISQWIRKRVEEIFGWMKTVGGFRKTRYRGVERTGLCGWLVASAYNLVRMAKLQEARAAT